MANDDAGYIMANDMNLQTLQAFEEVTNQLVSMIEGMEEALLNKKPVDKKRLIAGLQNRIEQMEAIIRIKDLTDICTDYAIPQYGPFTRLEWAWFNIYHTERHIRQLKKNLND